MELQQGFVTPDGKVFTSKSEALDYLRKPQILAALAKITGGNAELDNWLCDNRTDIAETFESTKIKRVTKSEKKALEKALEAVKAAGDKAFAFIADNSEAILESFRWPSVKRGTEEEQAAQLRANFMALTGDNVELTDWVLSNKEAVLEAFEAGKVKREISPKAAEGLAAYQAKKAAEKAAAKAAADAGNAA